MRNTGSKVWNSREFIIFLIFTSLFCELMIVTVLITFSWGEDRDMTTDEEFSIVAGTLKCSEYSSLTLWDWQQGWDSKEQIHSVLWSLSLTYI